MRIGRVRGTVVATFQHAAFDHQRLLVVDYLDASGDPDGSYVIAIDRVDSGVGDRVLVLDEGSSARQILAMETAPTRAVVVGVVDDVDLLADPDRH